MTTDITTRDAAFDEEAISWWRDWRRYLELQIALLSAQTSPTSSISAADAFELDEQGSDPTGRLQGQLATLAVERRKVFDRAYEQRRATVYSQIESTARAAGDRRKLPDPDAVERAALAELLAEAEGCDGAGQASGIGVVPLDDGWYEIELAKVDALPSDAAYRIGRGSARQDRRQRLATFAIVGVGALLMIWMLFFRNGARATADLSQEVLLNGQPIALWTPRELLLTLADGTSATLPVLSERRDDAPIAVRQGTGIRPLHLCIPEAMLEQARSVRLVSAGDIPARLYSFQETERGADLLLSSCDGEKSRTALLQMTEAPTALPPGTPADLSQDQAVTLKAITVIGPGDDPTLPLGQVSVVVQAQSAQALDWPAHNPTLTLISGQMLQPVATEAISTGVVLRYAIPVFTRPLEIAWSVTDPASGQVQRWRTILAPPPNRSAVLATRLEARIAAQASDDSTLTLKISVRNRTEQPLLLVDSDLFVTQDGQRLPLPALVDLQTPLAAGEARELTIALPGSAHTRLTVALGGSVVRIEP